MLIKKVGGLDELEKQLQMRLNLNQNSPVVSRTTTTVSPISQSLYNKVVGTKRGNLRTQKVINSGSGGTTSGSEIEPLVQRQNKENRYSSVIRNSRPRPQNDGIDQLSEIDGGGIVREKPQYVTITRTHAPKTQNNDDDSDDEPTSVTAATNLDESNESSATHQPTYQYVNIQRPRASTTTAPADSDDENEDDNSDDHDDDEDEQEETSKVQPTTTSKMHYVNIQRVRPTKPQYLSDEVESETPETK